MNGHHHHSGIGGISRHKEVGRLKWVLAITLIFMIAEIVGGVLSKSLALLADAGHMFTDVAALSLSLFAMRLAQRPPSKMKTFGYVRLEILAALINGATLLVIAGLILLEAWQRLRSPGRDQWDHHVECRDAWFGGERGRCSTVAVTRAR